MRYMNETFNKWMSIDKVFHMYLVLVSYSARDVCAGVGWSGVECGGGRGVGW